MSHNDDICNIYLSFLKTKKCNKFFFLNKLSFIRKFWCHFERSTDIKSNYHVKSKIDLWMTNSMQHTLTFRMTVYYDNEIRQNLCTKTKWQKNHTNKDLLIRGLKEYFVFEIKTKFLMLRNIKHQIEIESNAGCLLESVQWKYLSHFYYAFKINFKNS